MSHAVSVRLPEELTRALERVAQTIDRPKTYLIRKALEAYLADYADYQIALDRLHDKGDRIIQGSELRKQLGP
jgi:RHH-type rel operon transcriptional repressor/antitoxin RelB